MVLIAVPTRVFILADRFQSVNPSVEMTLGSGTLLTYTSDRCAAYA